MALNGGETAILEIEVDSSAFDDGMAKMEQSAKRAERQITADIEKGIAAFDKQATAAEKAAERQEKAEDKAHKKAAIAIAASIVVWKKFYDFIASGSGEASAAVRQLGTSVETLQSQVSEATASALRPLVDVLNGIALGAASSEGAIANLGRALASLALGPAGGLGLAATGIGQGQARGWGLPNTAERDLSTVSAQNDAARSSIGGRYAASMGPIPDLPVALPTLDITPEARGGGGGGRRQSDPLWQRYQREQAVSAQIRELQEREAEAVVAARAETADRLQAANEARIDQESTTAQAIIGIQQSLSDTQAALADEEIARAEVVGNAWRMQIEALKQMGQATLQVAAAQLLQSGSADKALRSGLSALGTMAGFRALFELAQAASAAVTLGMQWAVPGHLKSAAMFGGIAGAAVVAGKALYGGDYGRQSNGTRGGGGAGGVGAGMAAPRGSGGGGGGGSQKVEQTFIIKTSGDMLDSDRSLRRLARHIRDLGSRGYEQ